MRFSGRYFQRIGAKESLFWRRRRESGRYSYPCPGNMMHRKALDTTLRLRVGMFDRWVGRGNKAYGLYWRTHQGAK